MHRKIANKVGPLIALTALFSLASPCMAQFQGRPIEGRHSIPIVPVNNRQIEAESAPSPPIPQLLEDAPDLLQEGEFEGEVLPEATYADAGLYNEDSGPFEVFPDAYIPNMLGDFIGGFSFDPPPSSDIDPRAIARSLNRFKVADNNSPIPRTRLLWSYNYFADAFNTQGGIHRNFFGGEYAFFDQRVSADVRFNFNYFEGFENTENETRVGNLFTTFKGLLLRSEHYAVSGGLSFGWPTGDFPGELSSSNVYLMPFASFLYHTPGSRLFAQGFEQLDIPVESDDQMLLHTDFGIGYFLLYDHPGLINSIAGTTEMHLYTPLGNAASGIYRGMAYDDVLNLTVGATAVIAHQATLAIGMGYPISENKDYDFEVQVHFNWYFRAIGAPVADSVVPPGAGTYHRPPWPVRLWW